MSEEEKKAIESFKRYINSQEQKLDDYYRMDEEFYKDEIEQLELSLKLLRTVLNLIENQQKELNSLKEIEQAHKTDNGLLRQELDMQIEHNKELDNILYAKQSMIDELTQNEEKLKIELGKEKERNELFVASGNSINLERHIKNNYISKDKIMEFIKEETKEETYNFKTISAKRLKEFLEEK